MSMTLQDHVAVNHFIKKWNEQHLDPKDHIKSSEGFENYCETVKLPKSRVLGFPNSNAVAAFMKESHRLNHAANRGTADTIVIRPAAGGSEVDPAKPSASLSLSNIVGQTDAKQGGTDIVIQLTGAEFQELTVIEDKPEFVDDAIKVARVGASKQQWFTDKELYEKHDLCLDTTPLLDVVSAAGGTGTGYHGEMSLKRKNEEKSDSPNKKRIVSNVNSLLHAIIRCTHEGIIQRIKRDGTIEIKQPNGSFVDSGEKHPYAEEMMSTHLGAFGVVLSVEYECVKAFDIELTLEKRNLSELKSEIRDKKKPLLTTDDFMHFMYVPTYLKSNIKEKDKEKKIENDVVAEQNAQIPNTIVFRGNRIKRSLIQNDVVIGPTGVMQKILNQFSDFFRLGAFLNGIPGLVPFFNRFFVTKLEVGSKDEVMKGPSYLVRHYLKNYPHKILDTSFLQPIDEAGEDLIDTLDHVDRTLASPEYVGHEPLSKVMFVRMFLADFIAGISASSVPQGSNKPFIAALDFVTDAQINSFQHFREQLADYFLSKGARPHPGKWLPDGFSMKQYGEGYVNFVKGLLFDVCSSVEEFNRYNCDPSDKQKWDALLKKVSENPFINKELDRILELHKYPAQTHLLSQQEEKAEHRFQQTDAQKIKLFLDDLLRLHPDVEETEHGRDLMNATKIELNAANTSVNNNFFLNNKVANSADTLLGQQKKQNNDGFFSFMRCCASTSKK